MDDRPVAMALKIPIDVVLLLVRTPNEVHTPPNKFDKFHRF